METLPRDVHLYILRFLEGEDIQQRVRYLSRYWRNLSLDSYFWQCRVEGLKERHHVALYRMVPSKNEVKSWEWLYQALTHPVTRKTQKKQVGYRNFYCLDQRRIGEFINHELNGFGIVEDGNNIFNGNHGNTEVQGNAIITHYNHDRYEGEHKNYTRHGLGSYLSVNGNRYDGYYCEGERSGLGLSMCYDNGSYYFGEWKAARSGKGYMRFLDGATYYGDWRNFCRHGYGVATNRFGETWVGEWVDDRPVNPEFQCQWNGLFVMGTQEMTAYIEAHAEA